MYNCTLYCEGLCECSACVCVYVYTCTNTWCVVCGVRGISVHVVVEWCERCVSVTIEHDVCLVCVEVVMM